MSRRKVRWKEPPQKKEKTKRAPRFKQAELIKEENGVKWFRVTRIEEWPCTPSGSPRAGAECGIYLDFYDGKE